MATIIAPSLALQTSVIYLQRLEKATQNEMRFIGCRTISPNVALVSWNFIKPCYSIKDFHLGKHAHPGFGQPVPRIMSGDKQPERE